MNYTQFLSTPNLTIKMLSALNIIHTGSVIIKIDNSPNHDFSEYRRDELADYYFRNTWNFSEKLEHLISFKFIDTRIYDYDSLEQSADNEKLTLNELDASELLLKIHEKDRDTFSMQGFDAQSDLEDFNLKYITVQSIDNVNKGLQYEGSFMGDNTSYDNSRFSLYSLCEYSAVPKYITTDSFYKTLLAEGYLLKLQENYKLSFFIIYSALESFVYSTSSDDSDEKDRFDDKLKSLFSNQFAELNKHQIYTSVINQFKDYTKIRNDIAHGRAIPDDIGIAVENMLDFVLIMIICYENSFLNFEDLDKWLEK